jgi:hypothetical protein
LTDFFESLLFKREAHHIPNAQPVGNCKEAKVSFPETDVPSPSALAAAAEMHKERGSSSAKDGARQWRKQRRLQQSIKNGNGKSPDRRPLGALPAPTAGQDGFVL